ncbi:hypothetical protein [Pseudomonas sp. BN411]|uniref:hypothetical protein n=1 Tax=Pseudomonas sp. BN411 TaxID=2567887 RepID=UPI0024558A14|nr:hypothetical protein [Pseudomonas sp. BN411]
MQQPAHTKVQGQDKREAEQEARHRDRPIINTNSFDYYLHLNVNVIMVLRRYQPAITSKT